MAMGRFRSEPGDILALSGPITHASGMFIQPTLYQGATILLLERFQPAEVLAAIEKHRATMTFMVPTMIYALLAEPTLRTRDLSSLAWYNCLGFYKLAIVAEGIHARFLMGQTVGEGFDLMGSRVPRLVEMALEIAGDSGLPGLSG